MTATDQLGTIEIPSFGRRVNGRGSIDAVHADLGRLQRSGARIRQLTVDPLSSGWTNRRQKDHFYSGAAPAEALAAARRILQSGDADAVLLEGRDPLRSGYSRSERHELMRIYPDTSIPEAYTMLARAYMRRRSWTASEFRDFAELLWANYLRRAQQLRIPLPPEKRFDDLTPLFRGVDCTNPVVDFAGALLLTRPGLLPHATLTLGGVGTAAIAVNQPRDVDEIAAFSHLREAFETCLGGSSVETLRGRLEKSEALLELYTCFPIVPLAALLESGLVRQESELTSFLAEVPVTVTAGMNLGRGAWSNAALNGLIAVCEQLAHGSWQAGLVHANGGLGERQGFVLVERTA